MDLAISFTQWLLFALLIIAYILTLKNRHRELFFIQLYIILMLLVNILLKIILPLLGVQITNNIAGLTVNIYTCFETILIFYFFYSKIKNQRFKKIMIIMFLVFFSLCTLIWTVSISGILSVLPFLLGVQCLIFITTCLFFIYEILKSKEIIDLKTNASFIATCGVLFYSCMLVPIDFTWSTFYQFAPEYNKLINLLSIAFTGILILSFIKAYLCPTQTME